RGDAFPPLWQTGADCRPNLRLVRRSVVPRENNALPDFLLSFRHGLKPPLEGECGSVERHFDGERPPRPDVADLPPQGLLPRQPGRSPRADGEWTVELKLSGRVIPVLDIDSPVPRERGAHLGFDGTLNLVDDVIHDR